MPLLSRSLSPQELSPGSYVVVVRLRRPLDFERRSSYAMRIRATDLSSGGEASLSAETTQFVQVVDVQDQGPAFLNAPYSTTVQENTPEVHYH